MRIGELAREAGIGVETIRYYERRGLLAAPARTAARYRAYGEEDLARVRFIRRAKALGFGLEAYDGAGAFRTQEEGRTIDTRGELIGTGEAALDGPFDTVPALAGRIARSETARSCYVAQWFRYGFGRRETAADACTLRTLEGAFREAGFVPRALLLAVVGSDMFVYRTTEGGTR